MSSNEPLFIGVVVSVATGVSTWIGVLLHRSLGKLDVLNSRSERLEVAIYGDERDPEPNGLKRNTTEIGRQLSKHIIDEADFQDGMVKTLSEHSRILSQLPCGNKDCNA